MAALKTLSLKIFKHSQTQFMKRGLTKQFCTAGEATVQRMSVAEFGEIIKSDLRPNYQIIDCREPSEISAASIKGDDIIKLPMSTAQQWGPQIVEGALLDSTKTTLCLCRSGARSMNLATFLVTQAKFEDVANVEGGIKAYSERIDPSVGEVV